MAGPRTEVRDLAIAALLRVTSLGELTVVKTFDAPEDITKYPTLCVVVTDETVQSHTLHQADVTLTVLIVIYVRSEQDCRAALDTAIEEIHRAIQHDLALRRVAWQVELGEINADEGTRIARPVAQAIMRWRMHVRRSLTF